MSSVPRVGVIGTGLVGQRAAVDLAGRGAQVVAAGRSSIGEATSASPTCPTRDEGAIRWVTESMIDAEPCDVVVLATDSMHQVEAADRWLRRGVGVVATADRPEAVRALWTLAGTARRTGASLAVGAAGAPGLSTLLVERLADRFEHVDAITTARFGTGGPTCAREHHRSMAGRAFEIRDGNSRWVRGGSGRHLVWFPEPVGPQDCYRAGLAEPFLLRQRHPLVARIQGLQAATRRDRLTARLPMLRPPHPEGLAGAVWVEVRGTTREGRVEHQVVAATGPPATVTASVAAVVAWRQVTHECPVGQPLSWCDDAPNLLADLAPCFRLWEYDGAAQGRSDPSYAVQAARKRLPTRRFGS